MKKKVMDIQACGEYYKGYHEDGKANPWRLYKLTWGLRKSGCGMTWHSRCVGQWENFEGMLLGITQRYGDNRRAWSD